MNHAIEGTTILPLFAYILAAAHAKTSLRSLFFLHNRLFT